MVCVQDVSHPSGCPARIVELWRVSPVLWTQLRAVKCRHWATAASMKMGKCVRYYTHTTLTLCFAVSPVSSVQWLSAQNPSQHRRTSARCGNKMLTLLSLACVGLFQISRFRLLSVAMPHDFFKYNQQPNSLYFLIELFGLSINQFEFLKSVQRFKRYRCFCV